MFSRLLRAHSHLPGLSDRISRLTLLFTAFFKYTPSIIQAPPPFCQPSNCGLSSGLYRTPEQRVSLRGAKRRGNLLLLRWSKPRYRRLPRAFGPRNDSGNGAAGYMDPATQSSYLFGGSKPPPYKGRFRQRGKPQFIFPWSPTGPRPPPRYPRPACRRSWAGSSPGRTRR